MHPKQKTWPHGVTCGTSGSSSRQMGHAGGVCAHDSTLTTSAHSTIASGSDRLPWPGTRRADSASTRTLKCAWTKASRDSGALDRRPLRCVLLRSRRVLRPPPPAACC